VGGVGRWEDREAAIPKLRIIAKVDIHVGVNDSCGFERDEDAQGPFRNCDCGEIGNAAGTIHDK
jgi:hypothetical protein